MIIRLGLADRREGLRERDCSVSLVGAGEEIRPVIGRHQLGDGAEIDLEDAIRLDLLRG